MTSTSRLDVAAAGLVAFIIVLIVVVYGSRLATAHLRPKRGQGERGWLLPLLKDSEGWPSLARFQLFLWTSITSFAVLWISLARLFAGVNVVMPEIPVNLLAIVSIGTVATPISTSLSYDKYAGIENRPALRGKDIVHKNHWHSMLLEANVRGEYRPSLTRLQMFLWTWTGVVIYSLILISTMSSPQTYAATETLSVPDLSEVFVGLMGISQLGYLGGKAATKKPEEGEDQETPP